MLSAKTQTQQERQASFTDSATTRFVFISQAAMLLLSLLFAYLAAGQSWVYILTSSSFVLYAIYALRSGNRLFQQLMLMGLAAGFLELAADAYSVNTLGALVYPEGPKLWTSPLYMPLSWAIALTQLGYLGALLFERTNIWIASLAMGFTGALYIPLYEQLAKEAGWWYYHNCEMLWNAPHYIIICEALIGLALPLVVVYIHRSGRWQAVLAGVAVGAWILASAWLAYSVTDQPAFWANFFSKGGFQEEFPVLEGWVNLKDYSLGSIVLILIGTIFWNVAYYKIIRDGFRNKFVEMPVPAAASNLAWEFVWGFMFVTDLGLLFVWGLRIWFFMDLLIFYAVLRYGAKQLSIPLLKKHFILIEVVSALVWGLGFYYFIREGYDTSMGATSAYMITVIMASLYIIFYLGAGENQHHYARSVAWLRLIGNCCMSIFVFMHYPQLHFLQLLCCVVLCLNVLYVMLTSTKIQKKKVNLDEFNYSV